MAGDGTAGEPERLRSDRHQERRRGSNTGPDPTRRTKAATRAVGFGASSGGASAECHDVPVWGTVNSTAPAQARSTEWSADAKEGGAGWPRPPSYV